MFTQQISQTFVIIGKLSVGYKNITRFEGCSKRRPLDP